MIRKIILEILNDIDDEIVCYNGENLLDDGVIDSFTIMEIVSEIGEKIGVLIDPEDITEAHFKTIDSLVEFVEHLNEK